MASQALHHAISGATLSHMEQLLQGLAIGAVLVDPAGTILWSNAASHRMHGIAGNDGLGSSVDDYRSRFVLRYRNNHRLNAREYPLTRLVAGDTFHDVVVEVALADTDEPRWFHKVSGVVMTGDSDEPDALALLIEDVTAQYEAEERFERMFNANPAPALIVRLSDQRYVRVNQGFHDMTGYDRDAVIGRSLYELDILAGAQRRDHALERLKAGETVPQMEAELLLPSGGSKLVIIAGQPIELSDEPCMLFTFADLEPRRKAETALRSSEDRFITLFRCAPMAIAVTSPDGARIIEANETFANLTGYPLSRTLGRSADELGLWNDAEKLREVASEVGERGGIRGCDIRVTRADGVAIDCLVSAESVSLKNQRCIMWFYQDISKRRHTELELIAAIEAVMKDTSWFSRSVMEKLANLRDVRGNEPAPLVEELTKREREVLELVTDGLDDPAIAKALGMSPTTVRNHLARIYAKVGVNRRSAAIVWARERGVGSAR